MEKEKEMSGIGVVYTTNDGGIGYTNIIEIFTWIWEDYVNERIENEEARRLLAELGLSETQVFDMMVRLQQGRTEQRKDIERDMQMLYR